MVLTSDRRWRFAARPEEVWAAIASVDEYPRWWPWLRSFEAGGLVAGERWECVVQPPVPYRVRFEVTLDEVIAPQLVAATVDGDVAGTARLELDGRDGGCEARLVAHLVPAGALLKVVSTVAGPLARFGHDWVLDTGARQFARRSLGVAP